MAKLANYDFNGRIQSFQSTSVPNYPGISIRFRVTAPGGYVDTRIAVWVLFNLVLYVATGVGFKPAKSVVDWDDNQVATIEIRPSTRATSTLQERGISLPDDDDASDLPYLNSPAILPESWKNESPAIANTSDTLTFGDFRTTCKIFDNSGDFKMAEVVAALAGGLCSLATVPTLDRIDQAFKNAPDGIDSKISIWGPPDDLLHPTFQYQYAIATLRDMAFFLLAQGRLAEMACRMFLEGPTVGTAYLVKSASPY